MAQLPLKLSTTLYVNRCATSTVAFHHSNLEASTDSSSPTTRASRLSLISSITHFFCFFKRRRKGSPSASKYVATISGRSDSDDDDDDKNDAAEEVERSERVAEFSAGDKNDAKATQNRAFEIASSFFLSNAQEIGCFMAKLAKAMNGSGSWFLAITSKDARRRLEAILVSVKQKGIKKVSALRWWKKKDGERFFAFL